MDLEDEGSIRSGDDVSKEKQNDVEEGLIGDNESIVEMNETESGKVNGNQHDVGEGKQGDELSMNSNLSANCDERIIDSLTENLSDNKSSVNNGKNDNNNNNNSKVLCKNAILTNTSSSSISSTNLIITMPKFNNDKKDNKSLKRTARISVRACCFINPPPSSPPYQHFSPPSNYQTAPPPTPLESPPTTSIAPPGFCSGQLLTTPKTSSPPLTSPPPTPTQPSKQTSPLAINLEPIELVFSTPPTSPHPFFDSLEDLPPRTTNPPPPQPTFDSIERLANHPPPVPEITEMEPPLLPLPLQLPPHSQSMWSNDAFPPLTHELFCEHFQRTQMIVNDLRDEMRSSQFHSSFVAGEGVVWETGLVQRVLPFKQIEMLGLTDGANVEANLRGPLELGKWDSILVIIGFSLAPPDVVPSVSETAAGLVLLLQHDAGDPRPDMSFNTSASPEYISGLDRASSAKVVSYVSPSMAPEETIPHHTTFFYVDMY
ncbi:hypothetical protein Tco_0569901 [Tanacetum coccineum]